jgi:hypothetical protein
MPHPQLRPIGTVKVGTRLEGALVLDMSNGSYKLIDNAGAWQDYLPFITYLRGDKPRRTQLLSLAQHGAFAKCPDAVAQARPTREPLCPYDRDTRDQVCPASREAR